MKSFLIASILCASAPLAAEGETSTTVSVQPAYASVLGKEFVQGVRADYQAGRYQEFLEEMEQSYQQAKKENELEGLIEIRKVNASPDASFMAQYQVLQQERNQTLLHLVQGDESLFAEKVRSAATPLSAEEEKAVETLAPLRSQVPGQGSSQEMNQLIEIDLANYYKVIHLQSLSTADWEAKRFVLEMARMDQMVEAASHFEDASLKQAVLSASATLDTRLSRSYDQTDLNRLAKGQQQPSSPVEEKVAAALQQSEAKMDKLYLDWLNQPKE